MKQSLIIFLILLYCSASTDLRASARGPERLIILGSAVAGAELVNVIIRLFSNTKQVQTLSPEEQKRLALEEERKKQEELEKLLAPSKLFEVIGQTNIMSGTNEAVALNAGNMTNRTVKAVTNLKAPPHKTTITTIYYITNYKTREIYEFKRGKIDYYAVAAAYYKVGKKEKAREFFLKTISLDVNKNQAMNFLIANFNMTPKEIQREAQKYK
ncbi:MAG: hypothetical protein PHF84_08615 [bacterium]|nr:hypothetical protein [bacterium]